MDRIVSLLATAVLLAGTGTAFAQPGRDDHMQGPSMSMKGMDMSHQHSDWKKGGHIARNDWSRGAQVDYREHHLRKPPRGYQWRQVDNNFVLAAVATGLIASVIMASH
jgi:Ni/Co efflux regulator RcnB